MNQKFQLLFSSLLLRNCSAQRSFSAVTEIVSYAKRYRVVPRRVSIFDKALKSRLLYSLSGSLSGLEF